MSGRISEEVASEIEVLNAIYEGDFLPRPPVWNLPSFAIRIQPVISEGEKPVRVVARFKLSATYPKAAVTVEIEEYEGLSKEDVAVLTKDIAANCKSWLGSPMCHEVVVLIKKFLEDHIQKNITLYDSMVDRLRSDQKYIEDIRQGRERQAPSGRPPTKVEDWDQTQTIGFRGLTIKDSGQAVTFASPPITASSASSSARPPQSGAAAKATASRPLPPQQQKAKPAAPTPATATSSAGSTTGATARAGAPAVPGGAKQAWGAKPSAATQPPPQQAPAASTGNPSLAPAPSIQHPASIPAASTEKQAKASTAVANKVGILYSIPSVSSQLQDSVDDNSEELYSDQRKSSPGNIFGGSEEEEDEGSSGDNDDVRRDKLLVGTDASRDMRQFCAYASRYAQEFDQLEKLGGGASGLVWKVRNKLDRGIYAVKKISLREHDPQSSRIQREVTMISRLVHKSIVRYYAAWMEQAGGKQREVVRSPVVSASRSWGASSFAKKNRAEQAVIASIKRPQIMFQADFEFDYGDNRDGNREDEDDDDDDDEEDEDDDDDDDEDEESDSHSSNTSSSSSTEEAEEEGEDDQAKPGKSRSATSQFSSDGSFPSSSLSGSGLLKPKDKKSKKSDGDRHLFIQMEYCPSTLRDLIDKSELWKQPQEIMRLLREILEGLAYIHGKKVIHRDLKPANIFLDSNMHIKIGDFGLATCAAHLQSQHSQRSLHAGSIFQSQDAVVSLPSQSVVTQSMTSEDGSANSGLGSAVPNADLQSLTAGIGTALYRAPELESVNASKEMDPLRGYTTSYDEKADLYSLGIILFEMCHPAFLSTLTERFMVITSLRKTLTFPASLPSEPEYDKLKTIILLLIQPHPENRPSAREMLATHIPPRADIDSSYLREITEAVYRPNSTACVDVLSILFQSQGATLAKSRQTFDEKPLKRHLELIRPHWVRFQEQRGQHVINGLHYLCYLEDFLKDVFRVHGGVRVPSLTLSSQPLPFGNEYPQWEQIEYLDCVGQVLVPRMETLTGYLRLLASLPAGSISAIRWCIEDVLVARPSTQIASRVQATTTSSASVVAAPTGSSAPAITTLTATTTVATVSTPSMAVESSLPYAPTSNSATAAGKRDLAALKAEFEDYRCHPTQARVAGFDVYLPQGGPTAHLWANVELMSVLLTVTRQLSPRLRDFDLCLRLGHNGLPAVLLRFIFWESYLAHSSSASSSGQVGDSAGTGSTAIAWTAKLADVQRRLSALFTHITDCRTLEEVSQAMNAAIQERGGLAQSVDITPAVRQRLQSVCAILSGVESRGVADDLQRLESMFYASDVFRRETGSNVASKGSIAPVTISSSGSSSAADGKATSTAASGSTKKLPDYTPLSLNHIGVPSANRAANANAPKRRRSRSGSETDSAPANVSTSSSAATAAWVAKEQRILSSAFDSVVGSISSLVVLLQLGHPSSGADAFQVPRLRVVLDAGIESIAPPHGFSVYTSEGFRCVLDCYAPLPLRSGMPPSGGSHASATPGRASSLGPRKRVVRSLGVLAEAGHYERYFHRQRATVSLDTSEPSVVTAGCTFYLENILQLLAKQQQRAGHSARAVLAPWPRAISPLAALGGGPPALPLVCVVTTPQGSPPHVATDYQPHLPSVSMVSAHLRSFGLPTTTLLHTLHGAVTGMEVAQACKLLCIPFLVTIEVEENNPNWTCSEVFLQCFFADDRPDGQEVVPSDQVAVKILARLGLVPSTRPSSSLAPSQSGSSKSLTALREGGERGEWGGGGLLGVGGMVVAASASSSSSPPSSAIATASSLPGATIATVGSVGSGGSSALGSVAMGHVAVAGGGASAGTHAEHVFRVVMLTSGDGGASEEGWSKRRRRDVDNVQFKLSRCLQALFPSPPSLPPAVVKLVSDGKAAAAWRQSAKVFVVDWSFLLLRQIGTVLLVREGAALKEELEKIAMASAQRKMVKQLLHELVVFGDELVATTSPVKKGAGKGSNAATSSSSSANVGAAAGTGLSSTSSASTAIPSAGISTGASSSAASAATAASGMGSNVLGSSAGHASAAGSSTSYSGVAGHASSTGGSHSGGSGASNVHGGGQGSGGGVGQVEKLVCYLYSIPDDLVDTLCIPLTQIAKLRLS